MEEIKLTEEQKEYLKRLEVLFYEVRDTPNIEESKRNEYDKLCRLFVWSVFAPEQKEQREMSLSFK